MATMLAPRNTDVKAFYRYAATTDVLAQISAQAIELKRADKGGASNPRVIVFDYEQFYVSTYAVEFAAYLGGAKPKPKPHARYVSDALRHEIERMVRRTLDEQLDAMRAAVDAQAARG